MSLKRCKKETDPEDLVKWRAYFANNAEREERQDRRFGMLMHVLCTLKKGMMPSKCDPIDFMPYSRKPEPEVDIETRRTQAMNIFRCFVATHNKLVEEGRR